MPPSREQPAAAAAAADGGIEENAMAILDTFGIKDSRDLHDDRAAFLEAVGSACLAGYKPSSPTRRMYDAVFQILQSSSSLELTIASFHLLMELGKQYPRVYLTNSGSHQALVIVKESWSPFLLGNNVASGEIGRNTSRSDHLFDSLRFSLLTEAMVEASNDTGANNGLKHIENMVLFQYLVRTLEADFVPRHIAYKESLDWVIIRESVLNVLLVINLDLIRKEADKLGLTSRADGLRNPILEVILEELTYNTIYLSPFLLAFTEWKWKLQIILQYFSRYQVKSAVRTRRSDNSQQDLTVESALSMFSTEATAKAMVKMMCPEVAQLLLAHAYQVCLSVDGDSSEANDAAKMMGASLLEISCKFVSAFQNLRKINANIQISQFEKEGFVHCSNADKKTAERVKIGNLEVFILDFGDLEAMGSNGLS